VSNVAEAIQFDATDISTLPTFVAVLRVLNRLRMLEVLLPAPAIAARETVIERIEKIRKRARTK
jgi:hypothetical protein